MPGPLCSSHGRATTRGDTCPGDDAVAGAETRSTMTTFRRWIIRALARPEQFPVEYRAERLDQQYPLARPAAWYEAQQEGRVRHSLR